MANPTDATPASPGASHWCHWHRGPSATARVIQAIERMSGPPYPQLACAPCREQRGLVAAATQERQAS